MSEPRSTTAEKAIALALLATFLGMHRSRLLNRVVNTMLRRLSAAGRAIPVNSQEFRHERLVAFVQAHEPQLATKVVLDVGCGRGWFLELLTEQGARDCSGCDWVDERDFDNFSFRVCDLNQQPIPWPDDSFDLIICSDVIEHLENPSALIRELHRVCRPGGSVFLTMPNISSVEQRAAFLVNGNPNRYKWLQKGGHISMPSEHVFRFLVGDYFEVRQMTGDGLLWRVPSARAFSSPRGNVCNAFYLPSVRPVHLFAFTTFYHLVANKQQRLKDKEATA